MKRILTIVLIISFISQKLLLAGFLAPVGISDTGTHALMFEAYKSELKNNNPALFAHLSNWRSDAVMEMTEILSNYSDTYLQNKKLNIFFPFSEWDTSVILPVLELIEREKVDTASIFCAYVWELKEIKEEIIASIQKIHNYVAKLHIQAKGHQEIIISFSYLNKPVHIIIQENNPIDAVRAIKKDLHLLYFPGFKEIATIDIVEPMWEEFLTACRDKAIVFTYKHAAAIFDLMSDWYTITKNDFSQFDDGKGAVFAVGKEIDKETLINAWSTFEDPPTFTRYGVIPSNAYDAYICKKALAALESMPKVLEENDPINRLLKMAAQEDDELPADAAAFIEKYKDFFKKELLTSEEINDLGSSTMFSIFVIPPMVDNYFFVHLNAVRLRSKGIDLSRPYAQRREALFEKMVYKDDFSLQELLHFTIMLLEAGEKIDPLFLVDLCSKVPEGACDVLCNVFKRAPVEGLANEISDNAVSMLNNDDKKDLYAACVKLLKSFANIPHIKEAFADKPTARHNFFIGYLKYLYSLVEDDKIPISKSFSRAPDEKFFTKIMAESIVLVFCNLDEILSYMYNPKSEPELIGVIKPELVYRIFLPIFRTIEMAEEHKGIVLTAEQKKMHDKIFLNHHRLSRKMGLWKHITSVTRNKDMENLIEQLRAMFKEDKEAQHIIVWMHERGRHLFVPTYGEWWAQVDQALYVGRGQTISQPSVVIKMIKHLQLKRGQRVLEIGSGSGFVSAVMARLVYIVFPWWWGHVYAVEYDDVLAKFGRDNIRRLPYSWNVTVYGGRDGGLGLPHKAPFDAILVSCGVPMDKEEEFIEYIKPQLKIGGRIVMPITYLNRTNGYVYLFEKIDDTNPLKKTNLDMPVSFVPMRGRFGHDSVKEKPKEAGPEDSPAAAAVESLTASN